MERTKRVKMYSMTETKHKERKTDWKDKLITEITTLEYVGKKKERDRER